MENAVQRVLLVENDPIACRILRDIAEDLGVEWAQAGNGLEGVEKIRELRPDIVITDWRLPCMTGIDLVRTVRAGPEGERPYIILVTALEDEGRLVEAFDAGVDDFIGKPLRKRIVAARIRGAQRIVRLQRENERHIGELKHYSTELRESNERLQRLAVTDELTGLPNRRHAMERIRQEWAASERRHTPLSCMLIDLDGFKQINDCCGHARGDEVLKAVARTIREAVRTEDVVCRVGGDEFLVICPGIALDEVVRCGERLLSMVEELGIQADGRPFGLSIGAAERGREVTDMDELINLADKSMYRAKQGGKNRVFACH